MCLQYKSFENNVGKGEIAHNDLIMTVIYQVLVVQIILFRDNMVPPKIHETVLMTDTCNKLASLKKKPGEVSITIFKLFIGFKFNRSICM